MPITVVRHHVLLAVLLAAVTSQTILAQPPVYHRTVDINGVEVFYREAGPADAPNVLLLHGFPTSSHMYRNLIPRLAERYHVVAPDYPGYGASETPSREEFEYGFDNMAAVVEQLVNQLGLDSYAIYLQDYGAPIGLRLASAHPERVTALMVQNGNAYDEGIDNPFWKPIKAYWAEPSREHREALRGLLSRDATIWQYTHGVRDASRISPDNWSIDQPLLDRPGNQEIQLEAPNPKQIPNPKSAICNSNILNKIANCLMRVWPETLNRRKRREQRTNLNSVSSVSSCSKASVIFGWTRRMDF
jgi:pimeloyl-ACP methyl ester carboxylesterase